jgi:hypothetical protein
MPLNSYPFGLYCSISQSQGDSSIRVKPEPLGSAVGGLKTCVWHGEVGM